MQENILDAYLLLHAEKILIMSILLSLYGKNTYNINSIMIIE